VKRTNLPDGRMDADDVRGVFIEEHSTTPLAEHHEVSKIDKWTGRFGELIREDAGDPLFRGIAFRKQMSATSYITELASDASIVTTVRTGSPATFSSTVAWNNSDFSKIWPRTNSTTNVIPCRGAIRPSDADQPQENFDGIDSGETKWQSVKIHWSSNGRRTVVRFTFLESGFLCRTWFGLF
jgi:hypothetical protein